MYGYVACVFVCVVGVYAAHEKTIIFMFYKLYLISYERPILQTMHESTCLLCILSQAHSLKNEQVNFLCFYNFWSTNPPNAPNHCFPSIRPYETLISEGGYVRGGWLTSHDSQPVVHHIHSPCVWGLARTCCCRCWPFVIPN